MIPLIAYVSHAVPGCCKDIATGLERLSCDNEWPIGDVSLSNEYRICEECDLYPVQDIDVAIDEFSAVTWVAIKMSNSPIAGDSEFSCLPESVDEEACYAEEITPVSMNRS